MPTEGRAAGETQCMQLGHSRTRTSSSSSDRALRPKKRLLLHLLYSARCGGSDLGTFARKVPDLVGCTHSSHPISTIQT